MATGSSSNVAGVSGNVHALSNAIAVAIMSQQSGSPSAAAPTAGSANATVQPSAGSHGSASYQQQSSRPTVPSALSLPSYLRQKRVAANTRGTKRPKVVQSWDRDIVCLPQCLCIRGTAKYPRGKYRARLGTLGLMGKIHFSEDMTVEEVASEVRSVFKEPMSNRSDFPFSYLQPTGSGTRTLSIPSCSSSFSWTAKQVARLGNNTGTIYILAQDDLTLNDEDESVASSDNEDDDGNSDGNNDRSANGDQARKVAPSVHVATSKPRQKSPSPPPKGISKDSEQTYSDLYSSYIDLVDLTKDSSSSQENSDDDDGSLPQITLSDKPSGVVQFKPDAIKAKHVLIQHQLKVITGKDEEDLQPVNVRRKYIFQDGMRAFTKPSFDVTKMLKVRFISEQAQDLGGPRREFFHHLMKAALQNPSLFTGWPSNVIPIHNISAVADNMYYVIGKIIATSLVQGGEPPVCFSAAVADFIVYDKVCSKPCVDDIPVSDVREAIRKVETISSDDELRNVLGEETFDFRFDCGYSKPTRSMTVDDIYTFVNSIWLHYTFFQPHAELQQLRKGFRDTLQMELLICLHPDEVKSVLCASSLFDVTPGFLLDSFVTCYSDNGTNRRTLEEAVILNWSEYVTECSERKDVTISNILEFLSGSSKLPAAGFTEAPSIHFCDDDLLPKASTCDVSITFSRNMGLLQYEQFKDKLDFCILGSYGFGSV